MKSKMRFIKMNNINMFIKIQAKAKYYSSSEK